MEVATEWNTVGATVMTFYFMLMFYSIYLIVSYPHILKEMYDTY